MYTNIIGTQQIVITAAFLGVMILMLIILRKKSTVIRASMKAGKRVSVVEDTAVSPTERLRLVKIDAPRIYHGIGQRPCAKSGTVGSFR